MASDIYWIEHPFAQRIAIAARPRAGDWLDDEIDHWFSAGIGLVVSLLNRMKRRSSAFSASAPCAVRAASTSCPFRFRIAGCPITGMR